MAGEIERPADPGGRGQRQAAIAEARGRGQILKIDREAQVTLPVRTVSRLQSVVIGLGAGGIMYSSIFGNDCTATGLYCGGPRAVIAAAIAA